MSQPDLFPRGEPLRPDALFELLEARRLFEPATAALAAIRITDGGLAEVAMHIEAMAATRDDVATFIMRDVAFHRAVASATGNETLISLLDDLPVYAVLTRLPRGILGRDAANIVLAEHTAIHAALAAHDPTLAHAAALLHVNTTEQWLRRHLPACAVVPS